jgi:hypothetical protein
VLESLTRRRAARNTPGASNGLENETPHASFLYVS